MIQLVVDGIFLDLYENDPPKITLQFDSFETFQPQSDYSQTFRVPATDHNYQFFQTAFEVNGYDFDVTQRREAQILIDGNEFVNGEIRLNKIYHSKGNKIDYEVLFLGKTRDFASKLGDKKLVDLDLSELNHPLDFDSIELSWNAYPQFAPLLDTGLKEGNVLYPLVDFGNTYSDGIPDRVEIGIPTAIQALGSNLNFFNNDSLTVSESLNANRFKPMVRAKYLVDKIFEESGFTYTSNFLNNHLPFYRMYVSAWGNEANVTTDALNNLAEAVVGGYTSYTNVSLAVGQFTNEVLDPANNFENSTFTAPVSGDYTFAINFKGEYINNSSNGSLACYRNNSVIGGTVQNYSTSGTFEFEYSQTFTTPLTEGDEVTLRVTATSFFTFNIETGTFKVIDTPDEIDIRYHLDNEYKQIDFIKDVFTKFKLVMVPDRQNPNNFIIDPWRVYVGRGEVYDWSSKLDLDKDVQIEPMFFNQKQRLEFEDKEDKDWLNNVNTETFKETFGTLFVDTGNDLLKDTKSIKTSLASTPVTQIQGANQDTGGAINDGFDNAIIPHIYTLEPGLGPYLQKKPIKSKTRLLFYNGLKNTGQTVGTTNTWYYNYNDINLGFKDQFPMVSPYQYMPFPFESGYTDGVIPVDLNWQAENGYIQFSTGLFPGRQSVYDNYWSEYVDLIYNKYSRRVIANFVLSAADLFDLKFEDVIFVKDAYYYVEKIENVPLGEKASVKVSLVKLLNYEVPQGGFIPIGEFWEDIDVNWEAIADDWGAF